MLIWQYIYQHCRVWKSSKDLRTKISD